MVAESGVDCYSRHTLLAHFEEELRDVKCATDMFEKLLRSCPKRLNAVQHPKGGHTTY